jgi:cytochrome bd-type quinol oxidase subunit 2
MIGVQAEESSTISGGAPSYVALFGAIKLQDLSTTARRLWTPVLVLTVASVPATIIARPDVLTNYESYPFLFVIPVTVFLALICIIHFSRKQEDRKALPVLACI